MTHGVITEPSLNDHIGKGREGKGRDKEATVVPHSSYLTAANGGLWITHRPAGRPPMQKSDDMGAMWR